MHGVFWEDNIMSYSKSDQANHFYEGWTFLQALCSEYFIKASVYIILEIFFNPNDSMIFFFKKSICSKYQLIPAKWLENSVIFV